MSGRPHLNDQHLDYPFGKLGSRTKSSGSFVRLAWFLYNRPDSLRKISGAIVIIENSVNWAYDRGAIINYRTTNKKKIHLFKETKENKNKNPRRL